MNIIGTEGNDNLNGTSAADFISGLQGNDNINGNGGQDSLYGGAGNDNIAYGFPAAPGATSFNFASAIVYGGTGADVITSIGGFGSQLGFNTLYGGTGNATTDATDGKNTFNLQGDINADLVYAGGGGDLVNLGTGSGNVVIGGVGNDTVLAGGGRNAQVNGNQGADSIIGSVGGGDLLHGGQGNDTVRLAQTGVINGVNVNRTVASIVASDLDNDLVTDIGTANNDILYSGMGNDSVAFDGTGSVTVYAGFGADSISISGSGNDTIYGGTGNSTLDATDLGNLLNATSNGVNAGGALAAQGGAIAGNGLGAGADASNRISLIGGGGNDIIVASQSTNITNAATAGAAAAIDTLTGGAGNDLFAFGAAGGNKGYSNLTATTQATVDSVTDFVSGQDQFRFGGATAYNIGNNANAQTAVNNSGATTLAAAAAAAIGGGGLAGGNLLANGVDIFSFQGSNYLVVNSGATATTYDAGDYLINVGTLTNVTVRDVNG